MCGFFHHFDPCIGLFLFYQPGRVLQKGICFVPAEEKGRHAQVLQAIPDIEILEAGEINPRLPFRRIDQLISIPGLARNPFDIDPQLLIAQVAKYGLVPETFKGGVQILEGASSILGDLDQRMSQGILCPPYPPFHETMRHIKNRIEQDQCREICAGISRRHAR